MIQHVTGSFMHCWSGYRSNIIYQFISDIPINFFSKFVTVTLTMFSSARRRGAVTVYSSATFVIACAKHLPLFVVSILGLPFCKCIVKSSSNQPSSTRKSSSFSLNFWFFFLFFSLHFLLLLAFLFFFTKSSCNLIAIV